ncbi:MAG: hypothetical protein ACRC7N_00135 [Clostridium sp.]
MEEKVLERFKSINKKFFKSKNDKLTLEIMEHAFKADSLVKSFDLDGLDFTVKSLKNIELAAGILHEIINLDGTELGDDQFETICFVLGGYVGEVVKNYTDANWYINDEGYIGLSINMKVCNACIFPITKVAKRIKNGPEDNIIFSLATMLKHGEEDIAYEIFELLDDRVLEV